jgi:hypothetical protein
VSPPLSNSLILNILAENPPTNLNLVSLEKLSSLLKIYQSNGSGTMFMTPTTSPISGTNMSPNIVDPAGLMPPHPLSQIGSRSTVRLLGPTSTSPLKY